MIETAEAQATNNSPLAWLPMEAKAGADCADLTEQFWPWDHHIALGRVDYHGRWVDWQDDPP